MDEVSVREGGSDEATAPPPEELSRWNWSREPLPLRNTKVQKKEKKAEEKRTLSFSGYLPGELCCGELPPDDEVRTRVRAELAAAIVNGLEPAGVPFWLARSAQRERERERVRERKGEKERGREEAPSTKKTRKEICFLSLFPMMCFLTRIVRESWCSTNGTSATRSHRCGGLRERHRQTRRRMTA